MYKGLQVQSIKDKGKSIWEWSHDSITIVPPNERLHADPLYNNQRTYPCVTLLSVMPGLSSICSTYHDYPDPNYWLVMSSRLQRGGRLEPIGAFGRGPRNQFLLEPPPRPAESSAANRPEKDYHGFEQGNNIIGLSLQNYIVLICQSEDNQQDLPSKAIY